MCTIRDVCSEVPEVKYLKLNIWMLPKNSNSAARCLSRVDYANTHQL